NAFCVARPPGHHATPDRGMGFCLFNSVAIAARYAQTTYDVKRVLIADWDVHHGNGTQDIFYARNDVWTGSLHADPSDFYPFFWGGADEEGSDEGVGCNVNLPLPVGSDGEVYLDALAILIDHLQRYEPDAVVVALGLDAHKDDPLAGLHVETEAFIEVGKRLKALSLPMVIVQEGGYPTEHLSANLAAFMQGFTA
ncbi:MAG: histone deacetylase family protein, partial [Pseudomonadota bacterium]|nr:histone deacetylase family protein [Pseudomonadota bacterium]